MQESNDMQVVTAFILAGGFGKRIRSLDPTIPKPLFKVGDRPVLFRLIDVLKSQGIHRIFVIAGYMGDVLTMALSKEYGDSVAVVIEPTPMGTGGCLSLVREMRTKYNLVVSGDLILEMDFQKLLAFHVEKLADITLTTHPNTHPKDSDLVAAHPGSDAVKELYTRPHPDGFRYENLVNASVAVVAGDIWPLIEDRQEFNFEKGLVKRCLQLGKRVYSYRTSEYIADMGTPDRLAKVERDLASGLVHSRSLSQRQRAVFIDRDGVLNVYKGDILQPEQIELLPNVLEALKALNRSPFLAILVTNQPHAAKGFCSIDTIYEINRALETALGNDGAKIDDVFICLHHPDNGYPGESKELKKDCDCRKPKPGMILAALAKYNIDPAYSFIIGDSTSDILAGKAAGVKTILVETGLGGEDRKYLINPDFRAKDFHAAVTSILQNLRL
jgi:mannose-1-phosphate guanylyltransferase / phosphomannomutase